MTLTIATSGELTSVVGSEVQLFGSQGALFYYSTEVFLHNMTASDTVIIRVYVENRDTGLEILYLQKSFSGVQDPPGTYTVMTPTTGNNGYRVTAEHTTGTSIGIPWVRHEDTQP